MEHIIEKLWQKHHVEQHDVEDLLEGSPHFRFVEQGLRNGEDVYAALAQTAGGRYLIVFFILKEDGRALVLSARDMTKAERKRYEAR